MNHIKLTLINSYIFISYTSIKRKQFQLNVIEKKDNELVFELIGCDPSFANALRRILLAEVPTVAIENVYMWNNTSIIHDEVLAHRLGMVPINVDVPIPHRG